MDNQQPPNINVKIEDAVLKGHYANNMQVAFSGEEFILDFMNLFPPQGIINARIFVSPGHMKRMIAVLSGTLKKYETQFGTIKEASAPSNSEIGFKTQ
ncbi:MAG: hypothetical protein A2660_02625 [Candidatus Doudnabacteria bacterium RIFCSPHIGHO2_01_FULL_45_18]|uniref:DUF3467 domain-containing protein n=1 Tax=Candidatus Doudnabacteria bacterium RIFCSPHIGHO2_01_FULL_45_18 TaxID=1817823 RepID=A0A1F5NQS6_9BACT|nr:MAG: hypothetical protein A2660_02625 [Candidatus Doudnabacteria bacterium RIFCSPHIGHO2_01_FULL_45_18]